MVKRFMFLGALAAAALLVTPGKVNAQSFTVDHYTSTDATYSFVNYGYHGASEFDAGSYECANIYVFAGEDPVACGSCFVSPNGSLEEDLHTNLLGAPVTGVTPSAGVIAVVYTQYTSNFCDPTAVTAPSPGLKTFRAKGASEIELQEAPLSAAELARLNGSCSSIQDVLSGSFNVTCGAQDPPPGVNVHNPKAR